MENVERLELNREVMLKLIKSLIDGEELEEISRIISLDPNLSLKLLKFINSSYFSLRKEIKSITHAVAYLGYSNLKDYIFVLLTSSLLRSMDKERIKEILKEAFAMKYVASLLFPEHEDESFMVGLLYSVVDDVGIEELKTILKKAGVSEYIINGLTDPDSTLAKIKHVSDLVIENCGADYSNPIEVSEDMELSETDIKEICQRAERETEHLMASL